MKKKKGDFKQASLCDLGYRPPFLRILWVGVSTNDKGKKSLISGATYEGLKKALDKNNKLEEFIIVDIKKTQVIKLNPKKIKDFMEAWKANYFNPKWGYKAIKNKFISS